MGITCEVRGIDDAIARLGKEPGKLAAPLQSFFRDAAGGSGKGFQRGAGVVWRVASKDIGGSVGKLKANTWKATPASGGFAVGGKQVKTYNQRWYGHAMRPHELKLLPRKPRKRYVTPTDVPTKSGGRRPVEGKAHTPVFVVGGVAAQRSGTGLSYPGGPTTPALIKSHVSEGRIQSELDAYLEKRLAHYLSKVR